MLTKKLIRLNISVLKKEKMLIEMAIDNCKTGTRKNEEDNLKHIDKLTNKLKGINEVLEHYEEELK